MLRHSWILSGKGKEESNIAVVWVTDGVDRCRVGFLQKNKTKHKYDLDGEIVQVVKMLKDGNLADRCLGYRHKGMSRAALIGNAATTRP